MRNIEAPVDDATSNGLVADLPVIDRDANGVEDPKPTFPIK
jgi:hypothetical protein